MQSAKRFASGPPRTFAPGETIFHVGERHAPAWLVLDGEIEITRRDGLNREARIVNMGVGQFTGEMSELSGRGTLAAGRAGTAGCTALPFTAAQISGADHRLGRTWRNLDARLHPAARRR